jgi:predicted PurR-regulated permease PerM
MPPESAPPEPFAETPRSPETRTSTPPSVAPRSASLTPTPWSRKTPLLPKWASSAPAPIRIPEVAPPHASARWILAAITLALVFLACVTFAPLGGPLLLATWMANLLRAPYRKVVRRFSGRDRAAAFITVALFLALVAPLAGAAIPLVSGVRELAGVLMKSEGGKGALEALVSRGGATNGAPGDEVPSLDIASLVREYGSSAYTALSSVASASLDVGLAVFIFYAAFYALLVSGHRTHAWVLRHSPVGPRAMTRFVRAFHEAGRALLVGTGLTALVQGGIATIAYLALGVPRALVLGLITTFSALIPVVGTGLVWAPVAAGLALTGSPIKAVVLTAIGLGVIGVVDNILRPMFARSAHLELNSSVVLVAMLGGATAFGAFGLFLGPLLVRLAVEALAIAREADVFGRRGEEPTRPGS